MMQFVIPLSNLNQPSFRNLWSQDEEEFGFEHRMSDLKLPCREYVLLDATSSLNRCLSLYISKKMYS